MQQYSQCSCDVTLHPKQTEGREHYYDWCSYVYQVYMMGKVWEKNSFPDKCWWRLRPACRIAAWLRVECKLSTCIIIIEYGPAHIITNHDRLNIPCHLKGRDKFIQLKWKKYLNKREDNIIRVNNKRVKSPINRTHKIYIHLNSTIAIIDYIIFCQ